MPIEIRGKEINFSDFKITNMETERDFILSIQTSIKHWIGENNIRLSDFNTLIINKLVYYSYEKIKEELNPNLRIRSGWYKYGPCYEELRRNEDKNEEFQFNAAIESDDCIEQIAKVCEEEIPNYMESRNEHFFYGFLKHVYKDKQKYPELKKYYETKHELAHIIHEIIFNKENQDEKKLTGAIIDFERAITDNSYIDFVGLDEKIIEDTLGYTNYLSDTFTYFFDGKDQRMKNLAIALGVRFDMDVQTIFAYANYSKTYEHFDKMAEIREKGQFERQLKDTAKKVEESIERDFDLV